MSELSGNFTHHLSLILQSTERFFMINLLELKNVTKRFKTGTVAMDNVSFAVDSQSPSIIAVAGESGSGKTTLAMMALGFLEPTTGQVLYKGKEIGKLAGAEQMQFRKEVQAVFQDPFAVYNPFYKVDHIFEVAIANFKLASSKAEGRKKIEEALVSVGLRPEETLGRYPHQLSGGQRQRLVVARALLMRPQLLVADEPVSMVDASLRATILETLRKLRDDLGVTILYITHDLTTAYHVCDHIIVLYKGSVMEAGHVESVIANPQHPYTQLLIDSIPWPDLTRKWGQQPVGEEDKSKASPTGCKFASRCPHVMDKCRQSASPLYWVADQQVAACYLYEGKAQLPNEHLGELFTR
jgi:oligopeptide/dipeptide ABC transporter ATP-binding protein